jgi:ferredoxin-nitrite reductase
MSPPPLPGRIQEGARRHLPAPPILTFSHIGGKGDKPLPRPTPQHSWAQLSSGKARGTMNKFERFKAEKDGLDIVKEISTFAQQGWESITEADLERLKWAGVFFRKHTPGFFMMRVRITNGITNATQLRTLAAIAGEFGRGRLDITTRQQIQLRWLRLQDIPMVLARLSEVGLTSLQTGMDNIRNVVGCPVAGLTPTELFDASSVARQFTAMFVGDKAFTNLPRKFNVTITGCRENCVHAETQDLALVPAIHAQDGADIHGFNVLVGGKLGSGGYRIASPLDAFVPPEEAAELCRAIILTYRDHGPREARNKSRLAFLLEQWGIARFRAEVERVLGRSLSPAGLDARSQRSSDHVGIFRQKEGGLNYVGLAVPVGRLSSRQLLDVCHLAERYGTGEIRLTPGQNLIIPHVLDRKIGDLTAEPLLQVLRYDPSEIMRGLVSCTGIEFCNLAVIETKQRALDTAHELEQKLGAVRPLTMAWSGCPAGCGNHHVADIGLLGSKARVDGKLVDAVAIFVGGKSGQGARLAERIMEDVPCDRLSTVLEQLVRYYPRKSTL